MKCPGTVDAEEVPIVTKLTDDEQMPMDTKEVPVVIKLGPESDADLPRSRCDNNMWSSYVNLMMLRSQSTPPCTLIAQSGLNTLEVALEYICFMNSCKFSGCIS